MQNERLLLISNSTNHESTYLDHCMDAIKQFLGEIDSLLFIPYASRDWDGYAKQVQERFAKVQINVQSIHTFADPQTAISQAKVVFIGGGNTFRLLATLYEKSIVEVLRKHIQNGTPYIGSSAGINVVCPTIKTTNDMPIIEPPSFNALNIFPFQLNPHFIDEKTLPTHMGETREERIKEFHEENELPVVGLREGAWLRIEKNHIFLEGSNGAKVFMRDQLPKDYETNEDMSFLLANA